MREGYADASLIRLFRAPVCGRRRSGLGSSVSRGARDAGGYRPLGGGGRRVCSLCRRRSTLLGISWRQEDGVYSLLPGDGIC